MGAFSTNPAGAGGRLRGTASALHPPVQRLPESLHLGHHCRGLCYNCLYYLGSSSITVIVCYICYIILFGGLLIIVMIRRSTRTLLPKSMTWVVGVASKARSVPTATVSAEAWQLRSGAAWKQPRQGLWRTICRIPSSSLVWKALSGRSGGECPVRMAAGLFSAARSVQRQVGVKAGTGYSAWT